MYKNNKLIYNPTSIKRYGTYRWFESQHPHVNRIVQAVVEIFNLKPTEATLAKYVAKLENILEYPSTETEIRAIKQNLNKEFVLTPPEDVMALEG